MNVEAVTLANSERHTAFISSHLIHVQPRPVLPFFLPVCDNPPLSWLSPSTVSWVWLDFLFVRVLKLSRGPSPRCLGYTLLYACTQRRGSSCFYNRQLIFSAQEAQSFPLRCASPGHSFSPEHTESKFVFFYLFILFPFSKF